MIIYVESILSTHNLCSCGCYFLFSLVNKLACCSFSFADWDHSQSKYLYLHFAMCWIVLFSPPDKKCSIFTVDQRMDFVECNHPDVNHVNGERDTHHEYMLVNYCNEQTGSPRILLPLLMRIHVFMFNTLLIVTLSSCYNSMLQNSMHTKYTVQKHFSFYIPLLPYIIGMQGCTLIH
jgi:hypothetical protein